MSDSHVKRNTMNSPSGRRIGGWRDLWLALAVLCFFSGCAVNTQQPPASLAEGTEPSPREILESLERERLARTLEPMALLEPVTATQNSLPHEQKVFSVSVRNAPFEQLMLALATEAELNLVMDKNVARDELISIEFNNIAFAQALDQLMAVHGYFYQIDQGVLRINALQTETFRIDYPLVVSRAISSVGGDILGGNTTSGDSETLEAIGNLDLEGSFSIEVKVDDLEHLNIWKQIEETLRPPASHQAGGGGILSELGRAQINRMSGAIQVTDRPHNLQMAREFLDKLQRALSRQVIIEAKIIEVQLNDGHQYGIDWNYVRDNFLNTGGALRLASNLLPETSTSTFTLNWTDTVGPDRGDVLVNALKTSGEVNVLSSPRLNVLNNQSAMIAVGKVVPFLDFTITVSEDDDGRPFTSSEPVISRFLDGLMLGITPQINEDGVTTLHVVPILTEQTGERTLVLPGLTQPVSIPIISLRESSTMVSVEDQSTIVIGGLMVEKANDASNKIPLLGDLPYLGALFSQQTRLTSKAELVITLTTTVVNR